MKTRQYWRRYGHIPAMIILQIIFIILFGIFVTYNPDNVGYGTPRHSKGPDASGDSDANAAKQMKNYPLFQDVHVMIFIGFGFLMTFLKKYGLSAVSLNMMCAVLSLEWATLVIGFFHMEHGKIHADLEHTMLLADFAAASVLISFGVVLGTTSPLQLIAMTLVEIVLFVVNEIIGREFFGAVDAGDSIFVHLFGAYFGMAASRMLYSDAAKDNKKQGSGYTSDLFSMVGTIFLWMFWPSFNSAAAAEGTAQHRAVVNTFLSLCGSVITSFAVSSLLNEHNKFVMEHIQNATLAGGVAVGAVADLFIQPFGALIIGSVAGAVSVFGYEYITPWIAKKFKIHDTCGVHNLHGIPGVIGTILSIIMAAAVKKADFGNSDENLKLIYPALVGDGTKGPISPGQQALYQFYAGLVTLIIAIVGGGITGYIMKMIGKFQGLDEERRPGSTIIKLVLNVGNVMTTGAGLRAALPKDCYFDDNLFFEVPAEDKDMVAQYHDSTVMKFDREHHIKRMSFQV